MNTRIAAMVFGPAALLSGVMAMAAGPAKPVEWRTHGGGDSEQRYSPLTQITADNVSQLGIAWYVQLSEGGGYQSTPLIIDGRMYVTTPWSKVYAFDAKTGKAAVEVRSECAA